MGTGNNPSKSIVYWGLVYLLGSTGAWAIPSPELVIGSAASISQLFALATALVGGGAMVAGRRGTAISAQTRRSRKRIMITGFTLIAVSVFLAGLNIYQYQASKQSRLTRLQATLNRPAVIKDANLRETSFTAQSQSPLGISTEDAATLLRGGNTLFIDVRENAENQMGTIPGAVHIRFPDVDLNDVRFKNQQVVLLCHNGNRSSETCEKLAALGIDCRFIIGGIEKWIVEGRQFTDETVRTLGDLRAIPDYSNKDQLLDTPDVSRLLNGGDVQIIDVRYPGDFAQSHLPGAVNLPMRATSSDEITRRITALPDKPIIAACYDRRGCFISQVLGYELDKAGYDFRGRYTLPWEYFVPKTTKPHIEKWLAEQNQSHWQKTISLLAAGLGWLAQRTHFIIAIFALALTTRMLILPVAIKAERDQITTARTKPQMDALKEQFRDDPIGKSEALKAYYQKHNLSPGRNSLTLLFLPITMLGLSAVQRAAIGQPGFGWLNNMDQADPMFVLPLLATFLGSLYLQLAIGTTRQRRILSWLIGFPVLGFLVLKLSAAGALYLVIALALLFVQRAYVTGFIANIYGKLKIWAQKTMVTHIHGGVIPLSYTGLLNNAGNKALRLSQLSGNGFDVPGGVVLDGKFLAKFASAGHQERNQMADKIASFFGNDKLAVRSSATAEDGDNLSFAGVFESRLDVTRPGLVQAILDVSASFKALHTQAYADGGQGNILVQRMVQPDYAGVLFTVDPQQPGTMIAEFVKGNAEDLVSGRVVPMTCRFGLQSMALLAGDTPMNFAPLLAVGQKIETLFDAPQDIEWTFSGGKFEIVQSRAITTMEATTQNPVLSEWARLFSLGANKDHDDAILVQDEMSEVLPRPTPLSLSYMQRIWARGGSVEQACDRLGIRYNPGPNSHLTTVFGRLYSVLDHKTETTVSIPRAARKALNKSPGSIAKSYETDFLPRFDRRMAELGAIDYTKIGGENLPGFVLSLFDEFISDVHAEVETINIAAGYHMQRAVDLCDSLELDAAALIGSQGGISPAGLLRFVPLDDTDQRRETLLDYFGHRSPHDYELADPRYRDDVTLLEGLLAASEISLTKKERITSDLKLPENVLEAIEVSKTYQSLKDAAKHQALRHLAEIRRALQALDDGLEFDGLVYFLNLNELSELDLFSPSLRARAKERRELQTQMLAQKALPATLTIAQLEASAIGLAPGLAANGDGLNGKRVSGDQPANGPVFITTREQAEIGAPLVGFQPGDILACSFVHPNWLPHVLVAGGVIAEVGGWLSHIAIVAREHNVTLVVGVSGWASLGHGAVVAIDTIGDVSVETPAKGKASATQSLAAGA